MKTSFLLLSEKEYLKYIEELFNNYHLDAKIGAFLY
jgi:hypothetical protein